VEWKERMDGRIKSHGDRGDEDDEDDIDSDDDAFKLPPNVRCCLRWASVNLRNRSANSSRIRSRTLNSLASHALLNGKRLVPRSMKGT